MKIQTWILTAAAIGVFAGIASAEVVSGTITNIDPNSGRVTLRRDGRGESVDVTIRDRASLASLRSGSLVSLDANRMGSGSWEASTVETAGASGLSPRGSDRLSSDSSVSIGSGLDRNRTTLDTGTSAAGGNTLAPSGAAIRMNTASPSSASTLNSGSTTSANTATGSAGSSMASSASNASGTSL